MKNIIQIGSVTPEYGGSTGGIAIHVTQLSKALAQNGNNVVIFSDTKTDYKVNDRLTVVALKNKKRLIKLALSSPYAFFCLLMKLDLKGIKKLCLNKELSFFSPENTVVHVHSLHSGVADDIDCNFKTIYTDHGFWQKEIEDEDAFRKRIITARKIISVSKYAQSKLISKLKADHKDKLEVIYNPIDTTDYQLNTTFKKKVVFFNGYSESIKRKGFYFFHSLARYRPDYQFFAVADDEAAEYLKNNPLKNLTVSGKLSYEEITRLYKESLLMVLPSKSESFGLVYIEAALNNVPVIGYKPVIEEFNNYLGSDIGCGFDSNTQTHEELVALFDKIIKKLDNYKAVDVIKGKFSWDFILPDYLDIYAGQD